MKRALCWIRRDLRLNDHKALYEACAAAEEVAVVFVFDTEILKRLQDRDDKRLTIIHRALTEVDRSLKDIGSCLIVRHGDPREEIPKTANEFGAEAIFAAQDHEAYALERDEAISNWLDLRLFKDQVVMDATDIGQPYKVFTPFFKAWGNAMVESRDLVDWKPDFSKLAKREELQALSSPWGIEDIGFKQADLDAPFGESHAMQRLMRFLPKVGDYGSRRDFPALDGTSSLSVDLRFGMVSVRECVRQALKATERKWLSELVWREFYQSVLQNFPHVAEATFRPEYARMHWPGDPAHFESWAEGQTGYPMVDAAMRCLKATGKMHNRLRMVVASFLTKDLLLDYRLGEAHFARYLLDFDLASNNGGWQWAAGTGVDAQPYFRIFNPVLQSRKFDPQGAFIRKWAPELAQLSDQDIHWPADLGPLELEMAGIELGKTYPHPMVDHHVQKQLAIAMFTKASEATPAVP